MKKLVVGILAHVDAGKTTLSEAFLYRSGHLRQLGRVDHQTAFLDTDILERERGITIFSKQAVLPLPDRTVILLDTPGHVDFSSEMERTLPVLDYAILVISGSDGVQGHTKTLWRLLEQYQIPTFLFINKMDLSGAEKAPILAQLKSELDDRCVDFTPNQDEGTFYENVAVCDEALLNSYLDGTPLSHNQLVPVIAQRKLFPCLFGSALKLDGVDEFLTAISTYTAPPAYPTEFGARVYKIGRDTQGNRLTYLKITGGSLAVKTLLSNAPAPDDSLWQEKINEIRLYSGVKYETMDVAQAGTVCAVTGLTATYAGQGLGHEVPSTTPILSPVHTYQLILPRGCDPHMALQKLKILEEEDPQLHIVWNEQLRKINLQLMGEIQLEILKRQIASRFDLDISFGTGSLLYRETISAPIIGIGHFEPLRHYAEVMLHIAPAPRGSGITLSAQCSEDILHRSWQRLVLAHLQERAHRGVLTGAPITDIEITLIAGRAHQKHTEGGDFRQATYRAVRQGLMSAESVLLEPWYSFRLEVPANLVGRAMSDLQRFCATFSQPETVGETATIQGRAPVSALDGYGILLTGYTRGMGRLFCSPSGYDICHNPDEVIEKKGYLPLRDLDHPADSVFCAHGAGYLVPWDEVPDHAHVENPLTARPTTPAVESAPTTRRSAPPTGLAQDKELQAIFERTYGAPKTSRSFAPQKARPPQDIDPSPMRVIQSPHTGPEYLLVDGYNIIFAWDDLNAVARDNLDAARKMLMDLLSNYQGFKNCEVILVFDAYKVPNGVGEVSRYHNISVVYTKEAETADAYIEKTTYALGRTHRVRVATSDGVEQLIILGHGALRVSARVFRMEVESVMGQISALLSKNNQRSKSQPLRAALQRAQSEKDET